MCVQVKRNALVSKTCGQTCGTMRHGGLEFLPLLIFRLRAHLYVKAAAVAGGNGAQHDDQLLADQEQAKKTVRHGRCKARWATFRNGESSVTVQKYLVVYRIHLSFGDNRGPAT